MSRFESCVAAGCNFKRPYTPAGERQKEWTRLRRDPSTCLAWLKAAGNPNLVNLTISQLSKSNYFLCDRHFEVCDGAGQRYLNHKGVIPKLFNHGSPLSDDDLKPFRVKNRLGSNSSPSCHSPFPILAADADTSNAKEDALGGKFSAIFIYNVLLLWYWQ